MSNFRNNPMANHKRIRTEPRQKPVRPGTPLYRALEATARAVAAKLADRKSADLSEGRSQEPSESPSE
jgi:hypothetical protein